jgi:hypothetical protein
MFLEMEADQVNEMGLMGWGKREDPLGFLELESAH